MEQTVNFGYLPDEYTDPRRSAIVIIPVAFDGTSTWMKGSDEGPRAIIDASANMELYDIETDSEVYKNGIFTESTIRGDVTVTEMIEAVRQTVRFYLGEEKFIVLVGGEHSVSIGSIRAHAEKYPDMNVLQLDAHCDLRDEYNSSKFNHACVMARVRELCPITQAGIRSMDVSEKKALIQDNVFFARDIHADKQWVEKVVSRLSENVYITIDLDVFDPAVMPSTGTPEPGGLFWYDVLELLKAVSVKRNIVGFDVVELCPEKSNRAPDFLAAKLIYKLLSYRFGG